MIAFIKDWILSICIAGIVTGLILTLAPHGNIEKPLKLTVSIFFLLVVITPFFNGSFHINQNEFKEFLNKDFTNSEGNITDFKKSVINTTQKELNNQLKSALNQKGIKDVVVSTEIALKDDGFTLKKVAVILKSAANIQKAKQILVDQYNIDGNIINLRAEE